MSIFEIQMGSGVLFSDVLCDFLSFSDIFALSRVNKKISQVRKRAVKRKFAANTELRLKHKKLCCLYLNSIDFFPA